MNSVDEYLASQPEAVAAVLRRVRSAIRRGLPGAEETISYRIPTYKVRGTAALYFAAWKNHYSIYPATSRMLAAFEKNLAPYKVEKSTIRFPLDGPVPAKLIELLAKFRAREGRAAVKG